MCRSNGFLPSPGWSMSEICNRGAFLAPITTPDWGPCTTPMGDLPADRGQSVDYSGAVFLSLVILNPLRRVFFVAARRGPEFRFPLSSRRAPGQDPCKPLDLACGRQRAIGARRLRGYCQDRPVADSNRRCGRSWARDGYLVVQEFLRGR